MKAPDGRHYERAVLQRALAEGLSSNPIDVDSWIPSTVHGFNLPNLNEFEETLFVGSSFIMRMHRILRVIFEVEFL